MEFKLTSAFFPFQIQQSPKHTLWCSGELESPRAWARSDLGESTPIPIIADRSSRKVTDLSFGDTPFGASSHR